MCELRLRWEEWHAAAVVASSFATRDKHGNNKYLGRQANTNTFLGKHWNWIKYRPRSSALELVWDKRQATGVANEVKQIVNQHSHRKRLILM